MTNITYKDIMKNSPVAYIWIKGIKNEQNIYIDLEITDINEACKRGLRDYNIIGKKLSELVLKEDLIEIKLNQILEKSISKGIFTKIWHNRKIKKAIHSEIYFMGKDEFIIKITEIDDKSILFSDILRNSPFSVWIKDKEGRYIDVNIKSEKILKKKYNDIIGKKDEDFWNEKIVEKYKMQDNEVMETGKVQSYQDTIDLYEDGSDRVYEITKWPYKDINGNVLGIIGMSIELVKDARLRENIEENQRNFEAIVNFSDEVFIIYDRNKAIYISPSFKKLFGEDPNILYEDYKYWKEYYHPEDMEGFNIKFDQQAEFIVRGNPKKSDDQWLWVKALPIKDERGNAIKKMVIIRDITERKKLDLELETLRMDFFANISHELRTPINVIYGALQVLKKKNNVNDDKESEILDKYLKIIDQNCLRLLKLANNLIDSTKIDAGYLEYKPQNFNIINFVEDICTSVYDFINISNLNLIFDTDSEEEIVAFDLDMMERIILNLLSNAIKFNEENGYIYVNINCDDQFINIIVRDTGIGIDEVNLNNIFGRFEQVSSKKVHCKEGSGIGLSLIKSLVELHNGHIKAKSSVGIGSEFTVSIPRIALSKDVNKIRKDIDTIGKVSRMSVEFSDIYI